VNRKRSVVGPKIVEAVLRRIEEGHLRPGERIVPREIALKFRISDIPVREAFCQLVGREILVERHGEGFFAATVSSATLCALYVAHGRGMDELLRRWRAGAASSGDHLIHGAFLMRSRGAQMMMRSQACSAIWQAD
jgi:DNA-binding GntR family transcriptional regulator